ncbi:MAG: protein BmrU [Phycisphaerae bacterium]|nr:MAG: protein BmrU [Phycisphaerae bacterium]
MRKRVLIFANPLSGRGQACSIIDRLIPTLQQAGYDPHPFVEHIRTLDVIPDPSSVHAIVILGGDGTLRITVQKLTDLMPVSQIPPILVIGLGTANLMQKHLGLRYSAQKLPEQVVHLLDQKRVARLDVARVNEQISLLMISCGLDSEVVRRLSEVRRGPITRWSYLPPILRSLKTYRFVPLSVRVDGQLVHDRQPAQVFVGNVAEYGTGFPVLNQASSTDRQLDVCVMPCQSVDELIRLTMLTTIGRHSDAPGVIYTRGQQVEIASREPIPIQVDGDSLGSTPARIDLLEEPLGLIVT